LRVAVHSTLNDDSREGRETFNKYKRQFAQDLFSVALAAYINGLGLVYTTQLNTELKNLIGVSE
jgi:hypothetical protein